MKTNSFSFLLLPFPFSGRASLRPLEAPAANSPAPATIFLPIIGRDCWPGAWSTASRTCLLPSTTQQVFIFLRIIRRDKLPAGLSKELFRQGQREEIWLAIDAAKISISLSSLLFSGVEARKKKRPVGRKKHWRRTLPPMFFLADSWPTNISSNNSTKDVAGQVCDRELSIADASVPRSLGTTPTSLWRFHEREQKVTRQREVESHA